MYLDIPVCAINTVLFLVLFGVGPYLASVGIKSSTQRKIGTVLILTGLGWYFALRNYYDVMFITKVVYTLVALSFAGGGVAIGKYKRNIIDTTQAE